MRLVHIPALLIISSVPFCQGLVDAQPLDQLNMLALQAPYQTPVPQPRFCDDCIYQEESPVEPLIKRVKPPGNRAIYDVYTWESFSDPEVQASDSAFVNYKASAVDDQESVQPSSGDAAQANNPLADSTAVSIQNYYIGEITELNKTANQFWLRFAQPVKIGTTDWVVRASMPLNSYPLPPLLKRSTGYGDFNVFAAYLIDTGNPSVSFGIGPQVTVPTGVNNLGSGKWSAGIANVLFNASSPKLQYGYLLTWQASFAGDDDRTDVNVGVLQPFVFYQLGNGWYLRSAPIWVYNIENDSYSIPVGAGVGKVLPTKEVVYNLFVEPQWSVADRGAGYPEWQIYAGLTMQFRP